jgi:hypothetical protein
MIVSDSAKLRAMLPGVPLVESPFFDEIAPTCGFDPETSRIAKSLNEKGFAILRFPDPEIAERAARIKKNLESKADFETWRTKGWSQNDGIRIPDAWRFDEDVRAIATNPRIGKILGDVFGRKAWPFQTLNFPVGTQQHFHSDAVHFSSIPERFMCGVWLALEDINEGAGPLEYYPGSHKWPILYNDKIGVRMTGAKTPIPHARYHEVWRALVKKSGIVPEHFCARAGDALIWSANLLHGGSRQRDPGITRWSQVTHYFFENCCYITPMVSDVLIGKLAVREAIDVSTGAPVPNVYVDMRLSDIGTTAASPMKRMFPGMQRLFGSRRRLPADFDAKTYLTLNTDVAAGGLDAAAHYLRYGMDERRRYR